VIMRLSGTVMEIWRFKYWTHERGHRKNDGRREKTKKREKKGREKSGKKKGRERGKRKGLCFHAFVQEDIHQSWHGTATE